MTLVIFAALCFLIGQIKAETSAVRMVVAIVGIVLWVLQVAGLISPPEWLR